MAHDTRVFHKECRTLASSGHEVVLVVATGGAPTIDEGIRVESIPKPRNRWERFIVSPLRLIRHAWRARGDVYHLHDVEAIPAGVVMSFARRRVIWDSHEDLPRLVLDRVWIPLRLRPVMSRIVAVIERLGVRRFDAVISAEDAGARRFPPEKTVVVRNYPLRREFADLLGRPYAERQNVAAYVGDITDHRGAIEMIDAIAVVPADLDPKLVLAGRINIPGLEERMAARAGWNRTEYRGVLDREGVHAVLAEARVGLVLWHPTAKHSQGAVPVKLFEYMAAGLPFIASDLPAIREIVEANKAGVLVDPHDLDEIASALISLLAQPEQAEAMGARGRAAVLDRFLWESEASTLLSVYQHVSQKGRRLSHRRLDSRREL